MLEILKNLSPKILTSLIASYIKDVITNFVQKIKKPTAPTPLTSTETIVETTTTTTTKTRTVS